MPPPDEPSPETTPTQGPAPDAPETEAPTSADEPQEPSGGETPADSEAERGSARSRRALRQQRARKQQLADLPKKAAIRGGIALGIVALVSAGVWGITLLPEGAKDVHWHAAFEVYANGQDLSFMDRSYDLGPPQQTGYGTGFMRAHLHVVGSSGTDNVVHIEGLSGLNCDAWFEKGLNAKLTGSSVTFNGPPYNGQSWTNNATHAWKLYVNPKDTSDWTLIQKMGSYKPQHKDRLLFTYGNETKEMLGDQFDSVLPADQIPN